MLFYNHSIQISRASKFLLISSSLYYLFTINFSTYQPIKNLNFINAMHVLKDKPIPKGITLKNQDNEDVNLDSMIGIGKPSIVFFYPKDETYGCTQEVMNFYYYYYFLNYRVLKRDYS